MPINSSFSLWIKKENKPVRKSYSDLLRVIQGIQTILGIILSVLVPLASIFFILKLQEKYQIFFTWQTYVRRYILYGRKIHDLFDIMSCLCRRKSSIRTKKRNLANTYIIDNYEKTEWSYSLRYIHIFIVLWILKIKIPFRATRIRTIWALSNFRKKYII